MFDLGGVLGIVADENSSVPGLVGSCKVEDRGRGSRTSISGW